MLIYNWSQAQRELEEKRRHAQEMEKIKAEEKVLWIAFACVCACFVGLTALGWIFTL